MLSFNTALSGGASWKFIELVDLQVYTRAISKKAHIDFAILNSHVTVIFKIYQKHKVLCGKTENFKVAVALPAIYPYI